MKQASTAPAGRADSARHQASEDEFPILPLSALAQCFAGFPMRNASKVRSEKIRLLQPADVANHTAPTQLEQGIAANVPEAQFLQPGDVIFASEAGAMLAQVLPEPAPRTVAVWPLWVIRIHDPSVLHPEWLAWYLQTSVAQSVFALLRGQAEYDECMAEGLQLLRLRVPDVPTQMAILRMAGNMQKTVLEAQALWRQMVINNENHLLALAARPGLMTQAEHGADKRAMNA